MTLTLLLACYGITFFLLESSLTGFLRDFLCKNKFFEELLMCFFCSGFWVTLFVCFLTEDAPNQATNWVYFLCTHVMHGFAGATFIFSLNTLLEALERHYGSRA